MQAEILRRRAAEHRARWEAMKREEREAEARVRDDAAVAEALRRARTLTSPTHTPTTSEIPNIDVGAGGEERQCRICFAGPERGMLFSPCRCNGSMRLPATATLRPSSRKRHPLRQTLQLLRSPRRSPRLRSPTCRRWKPRSRQHHQRPLLQLGEHNGCRRGGKTCSFLGHIHVGFPEQRVVLLGSSSQFINLLLGLRFCARSLGNAMDGVGPALTRSS